MSQAQTHIEHAINWFEIPVTDMARSIAFYERLLGVSLRREQCAGSDFAVFPSTDHPNAVKGALMAVDKAPAHTDGVIIYLNAGKSLNAVLARLQACGGALLTPRVVLPDNMGCFAHIADPDGQRIGLHALD
jgi:predicted enzyme related to lactoylglutathione lyase